MALDLNWDFLLPSASQCGLPSRRNSFAKRRLKLTGVFPEAESSCAHSDCESWATAAHVGRESSSVNSSLFECTTESQPHPPPTVSRRFLADTQPSAYATHNPMGESHWRYKRLASTSGNLTQSRNPQKMCQSPQIPFDADLQDQLPFMQLPTEPSDLNATGVPSLLAFLLSVISDLCHSQTTTATTTETSRRSRSCSSSATNVFRCSSGLVYLLLVLLSPMVLRVADGCSTRPSPKPRPPRPQWVPDISVERENCTADYAALFCLNDGICFRTKVLDTFIVSCECEEGWYGRRCEYKDTPDRFLGVQQRRRIETASLAGGLTILIVVICCVSVGIYVYYRRRKFPRDIYASDIQRDRPFSAKRRDNSLAVRSQLYEGRTTPSPQPQIPPDLTSVVITPRRMESPRKVPQSFYDNNDSQSDSPELSRSQQNVTTYV